MRQLTKQSCRDATSSPVLTSQPNRIYIYIYIYIYIHMYILTVILRGRAAYPTGANGIIVLLNSLKSKNLKYEIRAKKREIPSEIEKSLMKMRYCVTPGGQTDVGSSQKTFLAFSHTSKSRH